MKRLSTNIASGAAVQVLTALIGLITAKFLFRGVGAEALGLIYFAATMQAVTAATLELGLGTILVREVAQHVSADRAYVQRLFGAASAVYTAATLVVIAAFWFTAPWIVSNWLRPATIPEADAVLVIRLLSMTAATALLNLMFASVLKGLQEVSRANGVSFGLHVLKSIGAVALVLAGSGVVTLAYWYAACSLIESAAYFVLCARLLPWASFRPSSDLSVLKQHRHLAGGLVFLTFAALFYNQYERLVGSMYLTLATFGTYGVLASLASRPGMLILAFNSACVPAFAQMAGPSRAGARRQLIEDTHLALCHGLALVVTTLAIFADPILTFLTDATVARASRLPFVLMLIGVYMNGALSVPFMGTMGLGTSRYGVINNAVSMPIMTVLLLVLADRWGIVGLALSGILNNTIWGACTIVPICRAIGLPVGRWLAGAVEPLVVACVIWVPGVLALVIGLPLPVVAFAAALGLAAALRLRGHTLWLLARRLLHYRGPDEGVDALVAAGARGN